LIGLFSGDVGTVKGHTPAPRPHETHQPVQERGLSGAVYPQEGNYFTTPNGRRRAADNRRTSVIKNEVVKL
jgi:hypothetical protein